MPVDRVPAVQPGRPTLRPDTHRNELGGLSCLPRNDRCRRPSVKPITQDPADKQGVRESLHARFVSPPIPNLHAVGSSWFPAGAAGRRPSPPPRRGRPSARTDGPTKHAPIPVRFFRLAARPGRLGANRSLVSSPPVVATPSSSVTVRPVNHLFIIFLVTPVARETTTLPRGSTVDRRLLPASTLQ